MLATTNRYIDLVRLALRRVFVGLILFLGMTGLAFYGFGELPGGFVPQEDEVLGSDGTIQQADVVAPR